MVITTVTSGAPDVHTPVVGSDFIMTGGLVVVATGVLEEVVAFVEAHVE